MKQLSSDVPLLIAGAGEDEQEFRKLAGNDPRIQFLGFVSDEEMSRLYANALAVLFVPKDEDFGYITVEAMLEPQAGDRLQRLRRACPAGEQWPTQDSSSIPIRRRSPALWAFSRRIANWRAKWANTRFKARHRNPGMTWCNG